MENLEESRVKGFAERCLNNLVGELAGRSVIIPYGDAHLEVGAAETMERLAQLFHEWIGRMLDQRERDLQAEKKGESHPVAFAQNYINEHYDNPDLGVEYLAGLVGLSAAYFGKQFHASAGVSCNDYIADVRMRNAARLLCETQAAVQDISRKVGVGSINYFYRLFKKKYGVTPVQYRKKQNRLPNIAAPDQNTQNKAADNGVELIGCHVSTERLLEDPAPIVAERQELGLSYAAVGPCFYGDRNPFEDQKTCYANTKRFARFAIVTEAAPWVTTASRI